MDKMDRKALLAGVRKEFGDTSLFLLGDEERLMNIKVRSSGSLLLDLALGGGYPHGRMIELAGKEKSGKTTLLNLAIAQAQINEPDKENAIIDLEHTYNPTWAKTLGVDVDKLFISQPDTYAEKVFDLIEYLVSTGRFAIIGLDSVAGLISKAEMEEEDWDKASRVGGNSLLIAKAVRKIVNSGILTKSSTSLICINQLRDKIGGFSPYGTPTTTPGGRSIKHAYTQQLDVSMGDLYTKGSGDSKSFLGQQVKIKVSKNKIAAPFKTASLDVFYEYGMDKVAELVAVAKEINVLSGTSWVKFINPLTGEVFSDAQGNEIRFQGKERAKEALMEDIQNNEAKLYLHMLDVVNKVLRGEAA